MLVAKVSQWVIGVFLGDRSNHFYAGVLVLGQFLIAEAEKMGELGGLEAGNAVGHVSPLRG